MTSSSPQFEPDEARGFLGVGIAAALLAVGLFALLASSANRDRAKTVAGLPCSILSETQISSAFGVSMQMLATDGSVCHYVSMEPGRPRHLFVIALSSVSPALLPMSDRATYLRHGSHLYRMFVAPGELGPGARRTLERQLAALLDDGKIAERGDEAAGR